MSLSRAIRRAGLIAGLVVLAVGATELPANAADFVFPSCPGFDVGLTPLTNHGNPVQAGPRVVVAAGSGTSFVDNETTGTKITFRGAGAFMIEENPDGSLTFTSSRWSRRASATSLSSTLRKKLYPVSFSTSFVRTRYFAQLKSTL